MIESFVILLREGIEAALIIAILIVTLRRTQRQDLQRSVFWALALAVVASVVAALLLERLPINEEAYEGALYWISAAFVASMMWWMHRNARGLRSKIESRVKEAVRGADAGKHRRESWALGAFAFVMIFREGAETVLFLGAVRLTTDAFLSLLGALLGLAAAVTFGVLFVRGSIRVNLSRFFFVTEWVLGIFVVQLLINGYHELSEAGIVYATPRTMAAVGPIVRNNPLFTLALVGIPLFLWLSRKSEPAASLSRIDSPAEKRLARTRARRERTYRFAAMAAALSVLVVVGIVYAKDLVPKEVPPPESASLDGDTVVVPLASLEDGKLHRFSHLVGGHRVRFLAMKTLDGKIRTGLDACEICGTQGYLQEGSNILCLNCTAAIEPRTIGVPGGCNPIPLDARTTAGQLRIPLSALVEAAPMFDQEDGSR